MRILITGGAGFIGCNLARELLEHGHKVVILDNLSTGHRENLQGLDVEFIVGDLLDASAALSATRNADSVVHLAALGSVPRSVKDPMATHDANATGTLMLLEAARANGVESVVSASSSSVYGRNPSLPKSERSWVRPMSPYAVSKLATEQYTLAYQDSYGMRTLAFRLFNVFGPWQRAGHAYAAVIPIFIDALLKGLPLPINGDGQNTRDFTYVGTVARILRAAVEGHVTHPEPVNLAYGTRTSIRDLANILGSLTNKQVNIHLRPPRPGDVSHSQADNSALRALFPGIEPVPLDQGLRSALQWAQSTQ